MQEHYNTLGIKYGSSKDEIKKAFHRLAHIHHPDKGGKVAEFIKVKKAYEFLMASSPETKRPETGWNYQKKPFTQEDLRNLYRQKMEFTGFDFGAEQQQQKKANTDYVDEIIKQQKIQDLKRCK